MAKTKKTTIADNSIIVHHADAMSRPHLSEDKVMVLTFSEVGFYYLIDELASKVWLSFDGEKTLGEIKYALLADPSNGISDARKFGGDVDKFCATLMGNDMITITAERGHAIFNPETATTHSSQKPYRFGSVERRGVGAEIAVFGTY